MQLTGGCRALDVRCASGVRLSLSITAFATRDASCVDPARARTDRRCNECDANIRQLRCRRGRDIVGEARRRSFRARADPRDGRNQAIVRGEHPGRSRRQMYVEQSAQDPGRTCRHQCSSDCTGPSRPHHLAASQRRCSGAGCDERTRSTADLHAVVRVGTSSAGRGNCRSSDGAIPPVDQAAKAGPQRRPPARSKLARKWVLARSALGALERARSLVCRRLLAWPLRLRGLMGLILVNRLSGVTHAFGTHVTQAMPRFCCAVLALGGSRQARGAQEHDAPDGGPLDADGAGIGAYRHRLRADAAAGCWRSVSSARK
jgi:hypothetical protein